MPHSQHLRRRRGALGQVRSVLGTGFQSVSSDPADAARAAEPSEPGTGPPHPAGNRAELRPQRTLPHHPAPSASCAGPMASHASSETHAGAPASRGIWRHLKLPRGRHGALRARPHRKLGHNRSDPLGMRESPMDTAGQSAA